MDAISSRALRIWAEADDARAIHPEDHAAVRATEATRALFVELARDGSTAPRDLFTACATLGRLLFEAGASPTLASTTIDGAARALAAIERPLDEGTLASARASVAEGYATAIVSSERARARQAWDWPACAVPLDGETCAIAAGHPAESDDAITAWAARVASKASKAGFRRVVVSGDGAPRAELESALRLVGVDVLPELRAAARSWLPWRRKKPAK